MSTEIERARDLVARATNHYKAIDADSRLTPDAKRDDKIRTYSKLRRELETLKAQQAVAQDTRKRELERKLFGLPLGATANDVMVAREAEGIALGIGSMREAAMRMNSARARGDDVLVKAIAARAVDAGWDQLVDAYVTDIRPDAAADLAELHRANAGDLKSEFLNEAEFMAFPPADLRMNQWAVDARARELDAQDGVMESSSTQQPGQSALTALLGQMFQELDERSALPSSAPASFNDARLEEIHE